MKNLSKYSKIRPLFGPSGHAESFAAEGHTATLDMPAWLSARGLDIFEYSFGRGVHISSKAAEQIGEESAKFGIEMSVHAPYFINFASPEPEKAENSVRYILSSLKILRCFGGERCVFHAGAQGGAPREEAFARTKDMFSRCLEAVAEEGYDDLLNVYPCVDFGHINALWGGALKTAADFEDVVKRFLDGIGEEKTRNMQVHFSKIQYGAKGEIRHLTFSDDIYGPRFEPLAEVIVKYGLTPHILSESAGTQAEDAAEMRDIWLRAAAN